uniref:Uncharacterized protein n=1 Tax=Anguilla anguilla TaxID=7936 RepID=A0A0E9UZR0_ANGAN
MAQLFRRMEQCPSLEGNGLCSQAKRRFRGQPEYGRLPAAISCLRSARQGPVISQSPCCCFSFLF